MILENKVIREKLNTITKYIKKAHRLKLFIAVLLVLVGNFGDPNR